MESNLMYVKVQKYQQYTWISWSQKQIKGLQIIYYVEQSYKKRCSYN